AGPPRIAPNLSVVACAVAGADTSSAAATSRAACFFARWIIVLIVVSPLRERSPSDELPRAAGHEQPTCRPRLPSDHARRLRPSDAGQTSVTPRRHHAPRPGAPRARVLGAAERGAIGDAAEASLAAGAY